MKQVVSLVLTIVMFLPLGSCFGGSSSRFTEEEMEKAVEITGSDLLDAKFRDGEEIEQKIYKVETQVKMINDDHIVTNCGDIYLDQSEMELLSVPDMIVFIGEVSEAKEEKFDNGLSRIWLEFERVELISINGEELADQ